MVLDPFLAPVEENLFLVGVEFARDVERAAEVVAKLVVFHGRHVSQERISVARPGVGVERIIPQVFVCGAMEVLRAGLSNDANLRPGRAAILGGVVPGQDLYLLRGIHVRGAQTRSVGARASSRGTVVGDQILRVARAIEIRGTLAESERQARRCSTARPRYERRETDGVPPIQLEQVNLLSCDQLLHRRGFRLQLHGRCQNLDGLTGRTHGQRRVNDEIGTGVELVVCGFVPLETRGLGRHGV